VAPRARLGLRRALSRSGIRALTGCCRFGPFLR
jgi:hypothetical protein